MTANRFSRIGDSMSVSSMAALATTPLVDTRPDLEATRLRFNGRSCWPGSFARASVATVAGATSTWAATPARYMLDLVREELRAWEPAFAIVQLGTNDVTGIGSGALTWTSAAVRAICEECLARGCTPILLSVPKLVAYVNTHDPYALQLNGRLALLAEEMAIRYVDWRHDADSLPDSGIGSDGIHPTTKGTNAADFSATGMTGGYNIRNARILEALRDACVS